MFAAASSHSSVETMWTPCCDSHESPPPTPEQQQQQAEEPPPSKSATRRAKHLLAALSFETPKLRRRRRRRRKAGSSQQTSQRQQETTTVQQKQQQSALPPPPTEDDPTSSSSSAQQHHGNIIRGLRVETSDSSCDGDGDERRHHLNRTHFHCDVYYDAAQYGDLASDEFAPRPQRDAVVLAGITVAAASGSAALRGSAAESGGGGGGGAYETVYRDHHRPPKERGGAHAEGGEDDDEGEDGTTDEYYDDDYFYCDGSSEFSSTASSNYSQPDNGEQQPQQQQQPEESVEVSVGRDRDRVRSHPPGAPPRPPHQKVRPPPPPPRELPLRFLRAGKNDPAEGLRRYEATLAMRRAEGLDAILREPSPLFALIKRHYPHYCHLKGRNGEPCFYEQPPRTNLKALRAGGVNLERLLRHYKMITEYQWQWCERDDLQHSIYVIDLEGIRMMDFVGESVEFVKLASAFSAQHYPERAGFVFVVNVPSWFKMIWTVVKPIVDEDTLHKIYILRGKDEIRQAMMERIPLENIPPEYGGNSMPLGESPEEKTLAEWMAHNNALADDDGGGGHPRTCCDDEECQFCNWTPARAY